MAYTIALAQCSHPENGDVLSLAADFAQQAAAAGADLLIFPEAFQTGPNADQAAWLTAAEPLDGPFCCAMNKLAADHGLWMIYTLAEKNSCEGTASPKASYPLHPPVSANQHGDAELRAEDDPSALSAGRPFNTAVVVDPQGTIRGSYRKVHLFDSATTCESARMTAGDTLFTPIQLPYCKLGLGICYDLRFPELTRAAAIAGADLMVFPAAWVDGPQKVEQWQTLLTARALENEIFVAGVCAADAGCTGYSCVADPSGQIIAQADSEPQLLTATLDSADLAVVRKKLPVWDHRRTDLY